MNTPERSVAIARALAAQTPELPEDFAAQVAALAEARSVRRWTSSDAALLIAFIAMIGVCVAGWFSFGVLEPRSSEWMDAVLGTAAAHPWLVLGVAGLGVVQALSYRQRLA